MLHIHQGFVRIECVIPLHEDWITSFWFTHGPRIQGTIREGLLFPSQRFDSLPYDPSRPTFVSWFTSPRGQQGVPMWQSQVRRPHHAAFGGVHSSAFLGPDSSAGPGSPSEMPVARQERATVRGVSWGGWTQEIHFTIRLIYRGQIIWQNKKSEAVEWLFWDVITRLALYFFRRLVLWFEWSMRGIYHVVCPSNEARTTVFIPNRQISQSLLAIFAERSQV